MYSHSHFRQARTETVSRSFTSSSYDPVDISRCCSYSITFAAATQRSVLTGLQRPEPRGFVTERPGRRRTEDVSGAEAPLGSRSASLPAWGNPGSAFRSERRTVLHSRLSELHCPGKWRWRSGGEMLSAKRPNMPQLNVLMELDLIGECSTFECVLPNPFTKPFRLVHVWFVKNSMPNLTKQFISQCLL